MIPDLHDVHCHLQDPEFDRDREAVIDRARAAGVRSVLAVASDLADAARVLEAAERHPGFIVPALGVHPDRAPHVSDAEVAAVLDLIAREAPRLGAVGEVGLDHRPCWDAAARARQAEVFRAMIRAAARHRLPLSVHSRNAGRAAIEVLREEGAKSAGLHAFDGRPVYAEAGAREGYAFSIPPSVVISDQKKKLVPRLPEDALLLESDSPVLGPERGVRNEPANLALALAEVARLRGAEAALLAARIAANTARFFPRLTTPTGDGSAREV